MKVYVLPEEIVSKIAAGEVIERPASVIKELVENALDAKADSIEIHLKDAGKTLIALKDSGTGIDSDDLEKIFLRHSTSKIATLDDLNQIHSLGFRGEALYSIAAISDIVLKSRGEPASPAGGQPLAPTQDQSTGWEIHVRGGKQLSLKPADIPNGTTIEVKELFFNTPARKKFLKANTAELAQILNTFIPYTLLYPQYRFLLTNQNTVGAHSHPPLLDLLPTDNLKKRIAQVLNLNEGHMLDIKRHSHPHNIKVHLILGNINIKRTRRDMQFIFINDRPVQNKTIAFHINQIYRLIMPHEFSPFFAAFIHLPAENIDVNIHPAKREVKIKEEAPLVSMIRTMCEQALMLAGQTQEVIETSIPSPAAHWAVPQALASLSNTAESDYGQNYAFPKTTEYSIIQEDFLKDSDDTLKGKLARARFIGAFIKKFLIYEADNSLLIVDQHAAAERIAFEKFIEQMEEGNVEVQHLLSPILIKLSVMELITWEEAQEKLEDIGLSCTQWDKETIALHAYPQLLKNPEAAVRHLLSGEKIARCNFETIARRACRSSVMAGDSLNREQAEHQRGELLKCKDPYTCPHGRPTVIEMKESFLDKQFLRT